MSYIRSMRGIAVLLITLLSLSAFGQGLPISDANLLLWVRADSGVVTTSGDRVTLWADQSTAGNDLEQAVNNFRPLLVQDVLNGHAAVRYDGANDNLLFPQIADARTIFWVLREDPDASLIWRPLVGDEIEADFFRGIGGALWHPSISSPFVREGMTRVNFSVIDGVEEGLQAGFNLVSLLTTGPARISQLSRDRTNAGVWDGDILEFLVFDAPLTENDILAVEEWMAEYYTTSLQVSEDVVVEEGLCEVVIQANEGFETYLWSTGETSAQISVNSSGSYWVEVTDAFGRSASDTVEVSYPVDFSLPEPQLLCAGDSILWSNDLPDGLDYTFEWNTGDLGSELWLNESGTYQFTATDAEGCVYTSPLYFLEVDSFPLQASLGEDLNLCAGNTISLESGAEQAVSYEWMDDPESNEPNFVVDQAGAYFLAVSNANGCIARDTVDVSILGNSPEVVILTPTDLCEGSSIDFTGSANADAAIASWEWFFSDGETAGGQSVVYEASDYGPLEVELLVTTEPGCQGTAALPIVVNPLPVGSIQSGLNCSGSDVFFGTSPGIPIGTVAEIIWQFNGESQFEQVASFTGVPPGFQEVSLTLVSGAGCQREISQLVEVLPSPIPSINESNACAGSLVDFSAEIDLNGSGNITTYTWFFGDSNTSNQAEPQHLYPGPGSYNLSLQVHSSNGCIGIDQQVLDVFTPPIADFAVSNACLNTPYLIEDLSEAQGSPISEWSWEVEELGLLEGPNPQALWTTTGLKEITLTVTSEANCSSSITRMLPVFELPVADFSFDPLIGAAPLEVEFTNLSSGGVSFSWDFGTGDLSDEEEPVFVFEENGTYTVALNATNQFACVARAEAVIEVTEALLDLAVLDLSVLEASDGISLSALIFNNSNFPAENARVFLDVGGEVPTLAFLESTLLPGATAWFTWPVILQLPDANFACVEVRGDENLAPEASPQNNRLCKALGEVDFSLTVFPNPLPSGSALNIRILADEAHQGSFEVFDASGRLVFEGEPVSVREGYNSFTLDTEGLSAGMYRLHYRSGQKVEVRSIVCY